MTCQKGFSLEAILFGLGKNIMFLYGVVYHFTDRNVLNWCNRLTDHAAEN
jgi:hypothetical protein